MYVGNHTIVIQGTQGPCSEIKEKRLCTNQLRLPKSERQFTHFRKIENE